MNNFTDYARKSFARLSSEKWLKTNVCRNSIEALCPELKVWKGDVSFWVSQEERRYCMTFIYWNVSWTRCKILVNENNSAAETMESNFLARSTRSNTASSLHFVFVLLIQWKLFNATTLNVKNWSTRNNTVILIKYHATFYIKILLIWEIFRSFQFRVKSFPVYI